MPIFSRRLPTLRPGQQSPSSWPGGISRARYEKSLDSVSLGCDVGPPELHELAAEPGIEQQVARELGDRRIGAEAAQEVSHQAGDAVRVLGGEFADTLRGAQPQHVDAPEGLRGVPCWAVQYARVYPL